MFSYGYGHQHMGHDHEHGISDVSQVSISVHGGQRIIQANGIPEHATGRFPNRNNPHAIEAQGYQFRMPLEPREAARLTPLGMHPFGVGVNGVPFDPGAAEWWNDDPNSGWQIEPMSWAVKLGIDQNNAHVQPTGAYHYHAMPVGLLRDQDRGQGMVLLGYAADGFPIYGSRGYRDPNDAQSGLKELKSSYRLRRGSRPSGPGGRYDGTYVQDYEYVSGAGDLDEANGRRGVTPQYPEGTYYYVITEDFPYIPRYFRGTPDRSFMRGGERGGQSMREQQFGPPHQGMGPPPRGGQGQGHPPPPPGGRPPR
ncbi:MAG: YHYH protein [Verrucomicrobiota bacterium]